SDVTSIDPDEWAADRRRQQAEAIEPSALRLQSRLVRERDAFVAVGHVDRGVAVAGCGDVLERPPVGLRMRDDRTLHRLHAVVGLGAAGVLRVGAVAEVVRADSRLLLVRRAAAG